MDLKCDKLKELSSRPAGNFFLFPGGSPGFPAVPRGSPGIPGGPRGGQGPIFYRKIEVTPWGPQGPNKKVAITPKKKQ